MMHAFVLFWEIVGWLAIGLVVLGVIAAAVLWYFANMMRDDDDGRWWK